MAVRPLTAFIQASWWFPSKSGQIFHTLHDTSPPPGNLLGATLALHTSRLISPLSQYVSPRIGSLPSSPLKLRLASARCWRQTKIHVLTFPIKLTSGLVSIWSPLRVLVSAQDCRSYPFKEISSIRLLDHRVTLLQVLSILGFSISALLVCIQSQHSVGQMQDCEAKAIWLGSSWLKIIARDHEIATPHCFVPWVPPAILVIIWEKVWRSSARPA